MVEPTITWDAAGPRLIGVPESVISPPGLRVSPEMMNCEALFAVTSSPWKFMAGAWAGRGISMSELPIKSSFAEGPRLMAVFETVIAGLPGPRVTVAMTMSPSWFAINW